MNKSLSIDLAGDGIASVLLHPGAAPPNKRKEGVLLVLPCTTARPPAPYPSMHAI